MKLYGFILQGDNPVNWETDHVGIFTKSPKNAFTVADQRDEVAREECIKQGGRPVLLFEVTGTIELNKPQFSTKKFTKDGELLPEKI